MTSSFPATTVDEDFGVNRGCSYCYTRTVHLGPYTVQVLTCACSISKRPEAPLPAMGRSELAPPAPST
jgi:hypothetical protein